MSDDRQSWSGLVDFSREQGQLARLLYVVFSVPAGTLTAVMENIEPHIAHQVDLERRGILFGAGPFAGVGTGEGEWQGEGMFIYRAASLEEATQIAESDPMHRSGARSFTIRTWLLNEGSYSVVLKYSNGRVDIG